MNTTTHSLDFTSKEIQIIELIKKGLSSKEIANHLFVSENTVRRHRQNIAWKAGTSGKSSYRNFIKSLPLANAT